MIPLAKRIIGTILVFVGIAGVFLPLMPGVIFIILGSALLGSNHRLVVKVKSMARVCLAVSLGHLKQKKRSCNKL